MGKSDSALTGSTGSNITSGMRLGPYEITGFLGAGAMGEVYSAHDTNLGRVVALKLLPIELATDPERLRRFEEEARTASALNHPAVVTIYDAGQIGSQPYISMELVAGQTLRELLALGAFPVRRALRLAGQVAEGLAKAHEAGLVHRDLKPENIKVSADGFAKILDFGLAKRISSHAHNDASDASTEISLRTAPGIVLGTVGYMSPEQASGRRADARSDQFSFGVVLYEMLTAQRAFARPTTAETLSAIIRDEPVPLAQLNPAVPPPIRWIVERCLAKHPEDRYALTRDLARDLMSAREHLPELLAAKRTRAAKRDVGSASIAVLPVTNLSADLRQEHLADSLMDALITALTVVRGVHVVSRASCLTYKGQKKLLPAIAEELEVEWILLAAIARDGNLVRITAQLVDAESDQNRWADSYTRRPRSILSMQEEVADTIVGAVKPLLLPGDGTRALAAAG
jgi:serine/threonine protein kinase